MKQFLKSAYILLSVPVIALMETAVYLKREGLLEEFRWRDIFFEGGTLDGTTLFDYRVTLVCAILAFFYFVLRVVYADREDGAE